MLHCGATYQNGDTFGSCVSASKQLKVQHKLAIEILQKFGHDYCRLEPCGAGRYRCLAWSASSVETQRFVQTDKVWRSSGEMSAMLSSMPRRVK